jgi:glycosyltransferase involved in cell wall biosynthesis
VRIITNIDGVEWRRDKWQGIAKKFLRLSEWAAVKFSHVVVTDNQAICDYVTDTYHKSSVMIPYGGDHALESDPENIIDLSLPKKYALSLCRIEPENNASMILKAFSDIDMPLVFVGNWDNSHYGRELKKNYANHTSITLLDPIYDPCRLRAIRNCASLYIHGHSAGGTNPSLVEMMHFAIPVFAYGCSFNRYTTEDKACYFLSEDDLVSGIISLVPEDAIMNGRNMGEIARRRYTWSQIGKAYFDLLCL